MPLAVYLIHHHYLGALLPREYRGGNGNTQRHTFVLGKSKIDVARKLSPGDHRKPASILADLNKYGFSKMDAEEQAKLKDIVTDPQRVYFLKLEYMERSDPENWLSAPIDAPT